MTTLEKLLGDISCDDCGFNFKSYSEYFLHRKRHTLLLRRKITEKTLLEGCCPMCFLKYCKKYKDVCLEDLLGSGKIIKKELDDSKKVMGCKYCPKCDIQFRTSNMFLNHAKVVHNDERPYACTKCNFASFRYQDLKRHIYIHVDYKMFRCHLCPKEYTTKTSLDGHLLSHNGVNIKSHDCPYCGKKFPIPHLLKRHVKVHNPTSETFKCSMCPKEFAYKQSLKLHMLYHTGEKPYECPYCQKRFTQRFNYRRHLQRHNHILGTLIKCTYCDKQFLTRYLLKRHMQTHEKDENAFICDICSKPFTREQSLNLHKLTHTGNMPFTCEYCDKKFTRISSYNRHRVIHVDADRVDCEHCGKSFPGLYRLQRHVKIHTRPTEKPFKCSLCPKRFSKKPDFKNHLLKHEGREPYDCQHCGKRFIKQRALKIHLDPDKQAIHTLRCRECPKTFKHKNCLTYHKRSHKDEYFCDTCKGKFLTHDGFRNHLKRHAVNKNANIKMEFKQEM